jgi:predicted lipid-binding transport protein (Tim44 family)
MPQQMPGGTMGGGAGGPMMGMMGRGGMMSMMMGDRIEGRIAFLKAELKITDVQMPQWNAFAILCAQTPSGCEKCGRR